MESSQQKRLLKSGWHLGLAALAGIEALTADRKTKSGILRTLVLGGAFGWHLFAGILDALDKDDE